MVVLLRRDVLAHGGLARLATARPSRCPPQGSRSCRAPGWSTPGRAGHAATGPSCCGCSVSVVAASVNYVPSPRGTGPRGSDNRCCVVLRRLAKCWVSKNLLARSQVDGDSCHGLFDILAGPGV